MKTAQRNSRAMTGDRMTGRPSSRRNGYPEVNVTDGERWITSAGGSILILYGLGRRTWSGAALAMIGGGLLYHGVSGRSSLYRLLGIDTIRTTRGKQLIEVVKAMTINRSQEEVYGFWRNVENLPRFMRHLRSVEKIDEKRSHWTAAGPVGLSVTWEAEIVNEKPNELIAWQSTEGAAIQNWGIVRFTPAPGGKGTEVKVELEYEPVAGTVGVALSKVFGEEPAQQIEEDLRRFKQIMETGEIPTTEGQPRGG